MHKQKTDKIKKPDELINADQEPGFQNKEEDTCEAELSIVKEEPAIKKEEKEKGTAELIVAKNELTFQKAYYAKVIDKNKELMFYRIVPEHMSNITKYAKAQKVVITLKTDDELLILSVADDGVGFDITEKSKGIGLKNIGSRVDFYSGSINIISAPGQGCTLEVFIPVNVKCF